uniref:Sec2p domain-containing protein n=1 Tax=Heterorhabditis bacteriophora TaxID=37862 RepID=A0A1I7XHI3_HETBA
MGRRIYTIFNITNIEIKIIDVDGMNETINLANLSIMCEGKEQKGVDISSCSPCGQELRRMQEELEAAHRSLAEKDEKMGKMTLMQDSVDAEVQELTEKLFQEAYKMVNDAEDRRQKAEKLLNESRLQVDVLTAEVSALKVLVQTPGMGRNHFQHTSPEHKSGFAKFFSNTSSSSRNSSISKISSRKSSTLPSTSYEDRKRERDIEQQEADAVEEVDPILFGEFASWRDAGHPVVHHKFVERIAIEEVGPCMNFLSRDLAESILDSIIVNKLELEPVCEDKPIIRTCALTNVSRFCPYRVRIAEDTQWHRISLLARNRIAAVCDYFTFVRYMRLGLIKSGIRDSYFDVVALRKNMCLAKLGLGFVPKTNLRAGY